MFKACIFDLDGTLADSLESIACTANLALEQCGLPPYPKECYKEFAGDGADVLLERCLLAAGDSELKHFEKLKADYHTLFAKNCTYHVRAYEGIHKLLAALKEKHINIAVLSNKPHKQTTEVVESLFGEGFFDIILGQSAHINRKPSPDGALIIADELKLLTSECIYIGDTNTDMQTGKAANMYTVGVTWGFRTQEELEENGADLIIHNPLELLEIEDIQ